jgi:hypothetical protein
MSTSFDLDAVRLRATIRTVRAERHARLPRHGHRERFLRGPIPWNWLAVAMGLPGHALHVGVALWHQAYLAGGGADVAHSATAMQKWGVSRYAARRGLAALEEARLVAVDRHTGRKAIVTILPAPAAPAP